MSTARPAVSRRVFLGAGLAAGVAAGVGIPFASGWGAPTSTGAVLHSRVAKPRPFSVPLALPPVLHPTRSDTDADYYEIDQRPATALILPGYRTRIWGYNGIFPGPTIVSRRGRTAVVTHTNHLPVPTVVHLHAGRTPQRSDGYPIDYVYPAHMDMPVMPAMPMAGMPAMPDGIGMGGDTTVGRRAYVYPLDQRAALLWYHDHRMDFTGPSVWRGLAGMHLVRDAEEDALRLPSGSRELPLMLTDRSFAADGSLSYPSLDPTLLQTPGVTDAFAAGVLGDVMLVNGRPWPATTVDRAHYRLRFVNACNARRLDLRLDPHPLGGLIQIGTDGGLLASPVHHDHFELAPAQRLDALVDFSGYRPGTLVTLHNDFDTGDMSKVMRFVVGERVDNHFRLPDRLSEIAPLTASHAVTTRTLRFQSGAVGNNQGWLIDAQPFSPATIAADPKLGTVEVWRLIADFHHPVHVHLNSFQVLSRGLRGPGAFDAGWKDTIDLRPAEEAAIAIRFDAYRGKYVFHCHNLEHEDMAMMANFVVS